MHEGRRERSEAIVASKGRIIVFCGIPGLGQTVRVSGEPCAQCATSEMRFMRSQKRSKNILTA